MVPAASAEEGNNPQKKISPNVLFADKNEFAQQELIVKFTPETSQEEQAAILEHAKVKQDSQLLNGDFSTVKAPRGTDLKKIAIRLLKNKQVALVEPNYKFKKTYIPKEPSYQKQWYLDKIQMPKAWDKTKGSSAITVAVIDDGVQQDHPELKGKIVAPYNAVNGKTSYSPQLHATHVAGIIAARINGKGTTGIAPNVKIMPINVFNGDEATSESVVRAIKYAADHHADIINMSIGSPGTNHALESAINYARSKGVLLVAAAGNDGRNELEYPAAYKSVLAVSAVTKEDKHAFFSNRGNYMDLAAPGVDIYSSITRSSYALESGTSMAAPVISGVAALVLSRNPFLTPSQVETILKKSTVDLGAKGWDSLYGYGRIDANKAVSNTAVPISNLTVPKTFTMTGRNKAGIVFNITGNGKVSLTIKNSKGTVLRKVFTNKPISNSKSTLYWDGKTDSKRFVSTGTYKAELKMTNGRKTVYKSTVIKVVNHTKAEVLVSGSFSFSPISRKVTIPYELTQKAKVTAMVTDQTGKAVKTLISKKSLSAGRHSIVWDGKNSKGKTVKDSKYYLVISLLDSHNKAGKTKKVPIMMDTVKPNVALILDSRLFKMDIKTNHTAKLVLKETANLIVSVKNDKGIVLKKLINKQVKPGTVKVSWNGKNDSNAIVPEGRYYYFVQAKDTAGNTAIVNSPRLTLQDWRLPSVQVNKDIYLKTEGLVTIEYQLNKPVLVTIGIYQGENLIKTIKTDVRELAGKQFFQWNGTDEENKLVLDGDYQFQIKVSDQYHSAQGFTGTIHVELTK